MRVNFIFRVIKIKMFVDKFSTKNTIWDKGESAPLFYNIIYYTGKWTFIICTLKI